MMIPLCIGTIKGIIVIQDKNSNDGGAAFRPTSGEQYTVIQIVGGDNIVRHKLYILGFYKGKDGNFDISEKQMEKLIIDYLSLSSNFLKNSR